jgi:hypothetical protein
MATYQTEIQWGGPNAPWHDHMDLEIPRGKTGESREIALDKGPPPTGTEIQWGGPDAPWSKDEDLKIGISNREEVTPESGTPATGSQVGWGSPNGGGNITFFDDGEKFDGSAQFPGEGPVGYRGTLKD